MRYLLVFLCVVLTSSCRDSAVHRTTTLDRPTIITRDREARLQPVIRYLDTFVKEHKRLPTEVEFRSATASLNEILILRDRTHKYTASKGAKTETDYMIGIWRADWFHYYKSWDRSFLNGSHEPF